MNRKKLLALARKQGFTGEETLDALTKFFDEKGITLQTAEGDPVDLKAAFANEGKKTVITVEAEDEDDNGLLTSSQARKELLADKQKADGRGKAGSIDAGLNAKSYANIAQRKSYNAKAARGEALFCDADAATEITAFIRLAAMGEKDYGQRKADLDIVGKTQTIYPNTAGGALVPEQYVPELIRLVESYGAQNELCPSMPMVRDVAVFPKRTAGLTVYYPGEGQTITSSDVSFQNVKVTAKRGLTLTAVSMELMEVSALSVADIIGVEIAQAFAYDGENKFFNGDGTSTYHGFLGWIPAMNAVSSNSSIVSQASGNTWSAITQDDFLAVMAALPTYALRSPNLKWAMNSTFYYQVAVREAYGLGGSTISDYLMGPNGQPQLLGKPVVFAQTLPASTATSTVAALLGDFSMGSICGAVNELRIAQSDQRYFDQGLVAIRGDRYHGQTIHAPGANGTAGPVVALKTGS